MSAAVAHILLGGVGEDFLGIPGLPNGWDGPITSEGMYGLARQLEAIPGLTVTTQDWGEYAELLGAIAMEHPDVKIAVIGYSGGGSRATWLANSAAGRTWPRIDLMVGYDPSPSWQMTALHANVKKAICYHNPHPLMFGLGGGMFTKAAEWGCEDILVREINHGQGEQHMVVQEDQSLHAATVQAVKDMMAA